MTVNAEAHLRRRDGFQLGVAGAVSLNSQAFSDAEGDRLTPPRREIRLTRAGLLKSSYLWSSSSRGKPRTRANFGDFSGESATSKTRWRRGGDLNRRDPSEFHRTKFVQVWLGISRRFSEELCGEFVRLGFGLLRISPVPSSVRLAREKLVRRCSHWHRRGQASVRCPAPACSNYRIKVACRW